MRALAPGAALLLAACSTLPGKVEVNLSNGSVSAGGCTCTLPVKPPVNNDLQPR